MKINSFKELETSVQAKDKKARVAVVSAIDEHTVEAATNAVRNGLIDAILIGDKDIIADILVKHNDDISNYKIIDKKNVSDCIVAMAELIKNGEADAIMKGQLQTGDFMRGILSKENDLRTGNLISVVALFEIPSYDKLLAVSDVAVNTYPDLEKKKGIAINAVNTLHEIGIENPKVAVISSVEKVNPKMPDSVDAAELMKMNSEGNIEGCIVEGPISFDIATDKEAAEIKGYGGQIQGDADLLLVPDIVSGNVIAKCITGMAGGMTAGTVVGAKVPVILTPRSASAIEKYFSIALAAFIAGNK